MTDVESSKQTEYSPLWAAVSLLLWAGIFVGFAAGVIWTVEHLPEVFEYVF